ncbi:MAG: hypothetical protein MZV63_61510 [Marinilabiliales bacterium]|nr:hypothetical protein [Marinilabiliales bacterium]
MTVDRSGRVTEATPGIKGSTTLDENLLKLAKEAALKTRFESSNDAPIIQKGTITYDFQLSNRKDRAVAFHATDLYLIQAAKVKSR